MSEPRILVAGIGNIFLGDDAFGVEVARRLLQRTMPENVRVADFGIRGLDLAYTLLDDVYDAAILVDAMPRGGDPGTLYAFEPELEKDEPGEAPLLDAHSLNPMLVLHMLRQLGGRLKRVLGVGCEPATLGDELEGAMGLSPAVDAAIGGAMAMVDSLVAKIGQEHKVAVSV
jgi:hydrogenase maturation protease